MQFDAIYDDGRLAFAQSVPLPRRPLRVRVEIADADLTPVGSEAGTEAGTTPATAVTGADIGAYGQRWLAQLEGIRTAFQADPGLAADAGRWSAFALREGR